MKKNKILYFLLSFIFLGNQLHAQYYNQQADFLNANNIWTFSDSSGLDFSNGTPPVTITSSSHGTDASASACDPATGDLLFYCDGERCFTANDQLMPNGDSLIAGEGPQAVCIVPFINDANKYYVFTIAGYQEIGMESELRYSVVDMGLNNGAGDIQSGQKNILIPTGGDTLSCAMIAIPGNNCDVWLMTHTFGKSVFRATHITGEGIDTAQVTSTAGHLNASGVPVNFAFFSYMSGSYFRSLLSVSPDRQYISISSFDFIAAAVNAATADMNGQLVCRFNPSTGIVSDPVEVENDIWGLGSAFSPDNSKLYLYNLTLNGGTLNQYDISTYDSTSIATSKEIIDTISANYVNFQLFRDTIYLKTDLLQGVSSINSPDSNGTACDFQLASSVSSTDSRAGLHSEVVYTHPDTSFALAMDTLICEGFASGITLHPGIESGDYQYTWNGGSTDTTFTVHDSGTYWVTYTNGCHYTVDTFHLKGNDIEAVITVNQFDLSTTVTYSAYQWLLNGNAIPGATNSIYSVTQNGDYQVVVTGVNGCTDTSDIYTVNNYTGIEDLDRMASQIKIFPVPTDDILNVKAPVPVTLILTSIEGRIVKQAKNSRQLSLADVEEGIYFLKIMDTKGNLIKVAKCVKAVKN
jgi:hypothetical protein